jgi:hypothetical protein
MATALKRPCSLLSIGRGEQAGFVKLIEVEAPWTPYAALSCTWGPSSVGLVQASSTLGGGSWKAISLLPNGVQDALEITAAAGVDFLWIPQPL